MSLIQKLKSNNKDSAFNRRMDALGKLGRDIEIIKDGVDKVRENLVNGARSLVVYGEPQSGKTEFMIALVCRLLDDGRKTIFVIMNDNTELEVQNYDRFKNAAQINPSPMTSEQFFELPGADKKADQQRIIFCRKNKRNLEKLITEARFLRDRIIIDDEADFASPDGKVNKDTEPTTINRLVSKLGHLPPAHEDGTYIGVTATPGRLDLNGTFANDSDRWVFLKSHENYKGREFFFPVSEAQAGASNYILNLLPEGGDDTALLQHAALRYMIRVALLNLRQGWETCPVGYSMLVHTDGKTAYHEEDQKIIQNVISILEQDEQPRSERYAQMMLDEAQLAIEKHNLNFTKEDAVRFVLDNLGRRSTLILNHKKDKYNVKAACAPKPVFTFAFGGNLISRGLTFNRLLTFYFTRTVKNKLQQNTYIQRARMFGNRDYLEFFELCVPEELFEHWADCFVDHELSVKSAKDGEYVHIASRKTSSADPASVDRRRTISLGSEMLLGEVFQMPAGIEATFSDNVTSSSIDFIDALIKNNRLPRGAIGQGIWGQIKELSNLANEEPVILLAAGGGFLYPAGYRDFNEETIIRARGGLVSQTIRGRPDYQEKPIIMPAKNKHGQMRFYYKNNMGKKVMKHLRQ